MRVSKTFQCNITIPVVGRGDEQAFEEILDGVAALEVPVQAVFTNEQLRIEMTIDVKDGRPIPTRCQWERVDGGDIEAISSEVVRGLPVRNFVVMACSMAAWVPGDHGSWQLPVGEPMNMAVVDGLQRATRSRRPISEDRIEEFADAYRESFVSGRMAEFAQSLGIGERQAYRLKKLAIDRGLLERGE